MPEAGFPLWGKGFNLNQWSCQNACRGIFWANQRQQRINSQRRPMHFSPPPPQAPATEGICPLEGDAALYYWDTGGNGPAVVFCHPATGSALSWPYQQPVFASAGYRVVGYSRRGRHRSHLGSYQTPGTYAQDLRALTTHLNIARFHMVGLAAGGATVSDFAASFPGQLLSMTVAGSLFGSWDGGFKQKYQDLVPDGFYQWPPEQRELSAAYRSACPDGVELWLDLEKRSKSPGPGIKQQPHSQITWTMLQNLTIPKFFMTGEFDLYQPPEMLEAVLEKLPDSKSMVVKDAAHAIHWEQPQVFNEAVLGFLDSL